MATTTFILGYPRKIEVSGNTIILKKGRFDEELIVTYVQSGFYLGNITPGTPESKQITALGGLQGNGDFHMTVADIGTWVTGDRISPMASSTVTWFTTWALLQSSLTDEDMVLLWGPSADTTADNESTRWTGVRLDSSVQYRSMWSMLGMYPGAQLNLQLGRFLKQFGETSGNYTGLIDVLWKNIRVIASNTDTAFTLATNAVYNTHQIIFERCHFEGIATLTIRTGGSGINPVYRACVIVDFDTTFWNAGGAPNFSLEACTLVRTRRISNGWNHTGKNCFLSGQETTTGGTYTNTRTEHSGVLIGGSGNVENETAANLKLFRDNCNDLHLEEYWPVAGSVLIAGGASLPSVISDYFGAPYDNSQGAYVEHIANSPPDFPDVGNVVVGDTVDDVDGTYEPALVPNVREGTPDYGEDGTEFTPENIPDFPAIGDVEEGVVFDSGAKTGVFVVPVELDVRLPITYGFSAEFTGLLIAPGGPGGPLVLGISPAQLLRQHLINESVFVDSQTADWSAFVSSSPHSPTRIGVLYDTTGLEDGRLMGTGEVIIHHGIQIRVRSEDYEAGWKKITEVTQRMAEAKNEVLVLSSIKYTIHNVSLASPIVALGAEKGSTRNQIWVSNFLLTVSLEDVS